MPVCSLYVGVKSHKESSGYCKKLPVTVCQNFVCYIRQYFTQFLKTKKIPVSHSFAKWQDCLSKLGETVRHLWVLQTMEQLSLGALCV
ncbi:hypothetical protein A9306_00660 [Moraxella atlantae]|uniref:Uncharacterized protein n=1 Tax=Faucicola atlantae TaxID=34059 RepID=A0A1B8QH01_9GAMM|nr:hypothetical protein A9306_00660 [Moraxella atlantae]